MGRLPMLGYTIFPMLLLFLVWNVYFAITLLPVIVLHPEMADYDWSAHTMYETHPFTVFLLSAIYFGGKVIPFAAATYVFYRLAIRSGRQTRWLVLATIVISLIGLFGIRSAMSIPTTPGSDGAMFGLEIGELEEPIFHFGEQLAQGLTPILILLALVARNKSLHGALLLEAARLGSKQMNAACGAELY